MTINKLSNCAVKICLDKDDFSLYNLDYSDININTIKKFLITISQDISDALNRDISYSKLFVEVFSQKDKCTVFVSVPDEKPKEKNPKGIICQFEDFNSLENYCHALSALYSNSVKSSSLYCSTNKLRLILTLYDEYENIRFLSSGYCCVIPYDQLNIAVTDEYYRQIVPQNALKEILFSVRK